MGKKIKHFTATVYVIQRGSVLLHWHKKMKKWLPPGGHIESNELPDAAAIREVREETGLNVKLVGTKMKNFRGMKSLHPPLIVQEEDIGDHYHIDFIYLASPVSGKLTRNFRWFSVNELSNKEITPDVRYNAKTMLKKFNKRPSA
jgi:8-oxo-dGTP pyrophosphatase MutT (NUDIX family)